MLDVVPGRILFDGITPIRHVLIKRIPGKDWPFIILPPQTDHFSVEPIGNKGSLVMAPATQRLSLKVQFDPTFPEPQSVQDFIGLLANDFLFKIHLIAFEDGFHDEDSLTHEKMATLSPPDSYFRFTTEGQDDSEGLAPKAQLKKPKGPKAGPAKDPTGKIFSAITRARDMLATKEVKAAEEVPSPTTEPKDEEPKKGVPRVAKKPESPKKGAKRPESPKKGAKNPGKEAAQEVPTTEPKVKEPKKGVPKAQPVVPKEPAKKSTKKAAKPGNEDLTKEVSQAKSPEKSAGSPPLEDATKAPPKKGAKKPESPKKGAPKPGKADLPKEAEKSESPVKSAKRTRKDSFPKEDSKVPEPKSTQKTTKSAPVRKGRKNQPPFAPEVWEGLPDLGDHLIPDALHPNSPNGKPLLDWQYQANWDNLIQKFP